MHQYLDHPAKRDLWDHIQPLVIPVLEPKKSHESLTCETNESKDTRLSVTSREKVPSIALKDKESEATTRGMVTIFKDNIVSFVVNPLDSNKVAFATSNTIGEFDVSEIKVGLCV